MTPKETSNLLMLYMSICTMDCSCSLPYSEFAAMTELVGLSLPFP